MSKKTVSQLDNLQSLKNEDLMYVSEYSTETTEFTSKNITFEDLKESILFNFHFPEGGYLSSSPDGKNLIYTNIDNNVAQITNFS